MTLQFSQPPLSLFFLHKISYSCSHEQGFLSLFRKNLCSSSTVISKCKRQEEGNHIQDDGKNEDDQGNGSHTELHTHRLITKQEQSCEDNRTFLRIRRLRQQSHQRQCFVLSFSPFKEFVVRTERTVEKERYSLLLSRSSFLEECLSRFASHYTLAILVSVYFFFG